MFGTEEVKKLVECAARALEREDRHIRECEERRGWPPNPWKLFGLRRNTNERYYQFVIWNELMASFPWRAETERDLSDFVFYDEAHQPREYAEIKGWWSTNGEDELPGIRHDMDVKLGGRRDGGVMLILTSHGKANADDNFSSLSDKLGVSRDDLTIRCFDTSPFKGEPQEFAVIGFLVPPKV